MRTTFLIRYVVAVILLLPSLSYAQETVIGLTSNGIIREHYTRLRHETRPKSKPVPDTLELPFFDDFSFNSVYPDPDLWEDQDAFVNFTYGVDPISIGVATLDAIDKTGAIYENANSFGFVADHLTSRPIDLDYLPSDDIYLSFFYQPRGLGDEPSPKDSLVLEFFSPGDSLWHSVWNTPGDSLQQFKQVLIPVNNPLFLSKGFKFRFKNYASLPLNASSPGMIGNCDHWHLDYIKLDKDRNPVDTLLNDVTMVKPIQSLLKNHEAMPWNHFRETFLSEMGNSIPITYTNHDDSVRNITRLFQITDLYENEIVHTFSAGAANIDPSETIHYNDNALFYTFNSSRTDSVLFEVRSYLITDEFDNKINDTIIYHQRFRDYFAYDDGSAEGGYGITGQGAENAKIAYQFTSYLPDTLYAIQIYFNQSHENASQRYFTLTVWGDSNGKPGEILYEQTGEQPWYENDLNRFYIYELDTPVFVTGQFYVGWQQVTETFLNLGFDFNRVRNNRIFYHLSGEWQNSQFPGALMIRPVMNRFLVSSRIMIHRDDLYRMYPNPANDHIRIEYPDDIAGKEIDVTIYDNLGRVLFRSEVKPDIINLSGHHPGIYFLVIRQKGFKPVSRKLIISR